MSSQAQARFLSIVICCFRGWEEGGREGGREGEMRHVSFTHQQVTGTTRESDGGRISVARGRRPAGDSAGDRSAGESVPIYRRMLTMMLGILRGETGRQTEREREREILGLMMNWSRWWLIKKSAGKWNRSEPFT